MKARGLKVVLAENKAKAWASPGLFFKSSEEARRLNIVCEFVHFTYSFSIITKLRIRKKLKVGLMADYKGLD